MITLSLLWRESEMPLCRNQDWDSTYKTHEFKQQDLIHLLSWMIGRSKPLEWMISKVKKIALTLQGGSKFYRQCWKIHAFPIWWHRLIFSCVLPVLYAYLASFSHGIFDIFSRPQINIATRSLEFVHSWSSPKTVWWRIF